MGGWSSCAACGETDSYVHLEHSKISARPGPPKTSLARVHLAEIALEATNREYGPEHRYAAAALANLGNAYGSSGDAERQRDLLEQALRIVEREHGPDHREVAVLLSQLGVAYGRLHDAEGQRNVLERALLIQEREFGRENREVAVTLANLSSVYGELGDFPSKRAALARASRIEKKEYHQRNSRDQQRGYGYDDDDHDDRSNNSVFDGPPGGIIIDSVERQRDLLEHALRIQEREYGPSHRMVATTLANLGNTYGELGEADKQRNLLLRALKIKEREYGPRHVEVAITKFNLARAVFSLGEADAAVEMMEDVYARFVDHLGSDHPQTGHARRAISLWSSTANDEAE